MVVVELLSFVSPCGLDRVRLQKAGPNDAGQRYNVSSWACAQTRYGLLLTFEPGKSKVCCPFQPLSVWSVPLDEGSLYLEPMFVFVRKQHEQSGQINVACITPVQDTHCMVLLSL